MHHNQAAQLDFDLLLAMPQARRTDPQTSHAAAADAKHKQKSDCLHILTALGHGPAIVDRLAEITGRPAHALGKRLSELADAKVIRLTGRELPGVSGSPQREWTLA
jgi:predicted transcriptional regulator